MNIRWELLKNIRIPMEAFELRKLTTFECIVYYLTYKKFLKQNEISYLLKRNPRTIWTILTRAKHKASLLKAHDPKSFKAWETKIGIQEVKLTDVKKITEVIA